MKLLSLAASNFIALLLLITISSSHCLAEISITGFRLYHCSTKSEICIEVNGIKADRAELAPIWSIKNGNVKMVDKKSKSIIREWSKKLVFIDEFSNQILVKDMENSKEWQISFETLKVNEF